MHQFCDEVNLLHTSSGEGARRVLNISCPPTWAEKDSRLFLEKTGDLSIEGVNLSMMKLRSLITTLSDDKTLSSLVESDNDVFKACLSSLSNLALLEKEEIGVFEKEKIGKKEEQVLGIAEKEHEKTRSRGEGLGFNA